MVNLIARNRRPEPFPEMDQPSWAALVGRLEGCVRCRGRSGLSTFETHAEMIASELDELEHAPSLASAASLIEVIDSLRREWLGGRLSASNQPSEAARAEVLDAGFSGELLCYFPGRSLATGEAEVSSRGYFDVLDRPPLWSWVGSVGRSINESIANFEIGILAWVALEDRTRARRGCLASAAPSLLPIEEASDAISAQWRDAQDHDRTEGRA